MKAGLIPKSIFLFIAAGICEIGGGYLVWLWLRNNKGFLLGIIGGFVLFFYGVVPTFQPVHFGRVYAAYGGVFVVLSILWGWWIDKRAPDIFDLIGGLMCLVGVAIIMYWPRSWVTLYAVQHLLILLSITDWLSGEAEMSTYDLWDLVLAITYYL